MDEQVISNLLLRTAELIDKVGWTQHMSHNIHGYCLLGGLSHTARIMSLAHGGRDDLVLMAKDRLRIFIKQVHLVKWNDAKKRTKEEVVAALIGAAQTEAPPCPPS